MCITITRDVGAPRSSFRTRRRPAGRLPRAQLCRSHSCARARFPTTSGGSPPSPLALALALALARLVTSSRSNFVIERARCTHAETALGSSEAAFARAGLAALARGCFSSHAPSGVLRLEGSSSAAAAATSASGRHWAGVDAGVGAGAGWVSVGKGGSVSGWETSTGGSAGRSAASGFDASPSFPSVEAASGVGGGSGRGCGAVRDDGGGRLGGVGWGGVGRVRGERGRGRKPRAPALGFEKGKESGVRASRDEVCGEGGGWAADVGGRVDHARRGGVNVRSRGRVASGDASASPARGGLGKRGFASRNARKRVPRPGSSRLARRRPAPRRRRGGERRRCRRRSCLSRGLGMGLARSMAKARASRGSKWAKKTSVSPSGAATRRRESETLRKNSLTVHSLISMFRVRA